MPYKGGLYGIKVGYNQGISAEIWHTDPKNMAYEPPLLCHMNRFSWGWGWSLICHPLSSRSALHGLRAFDLQSQANFVEQVLPALLQIRVFLNLWFAKPMVWVRVAFHENDGKLENNSDSCKQGVECWIRGNHGNHVNYENHEKRVPQTTGLETPDK